MATGNDILSSWARVRGQTYSVHLCREMVQFADTNTAEEVMWTAWFFGTPAVGGDPEIALIRGGKLVTDGLLTKGGLTG